MARDPNSWRSIPSLDFGGPVTTEEIDRAISDGVADPE
jgi:hypothetical protein